VSVAGIFVCGVAAVALFVAPLVLPLVACHTLFPVVIAMGVVVPAGRFVNFAVKGAVV
jgi:hypothetical protein